MIRKNFANFVEKHFAPYYGKILIRLLLKCKRYKFSLITFRMTLVYSASTCKSRTVLWAAARRRRRAANRRSGKSIEHRNTLVVARVFSSCVFEVHVRRLEAELEKRGEQQRRPNEKQPTIFMTTIKMGTRTLELFIFLF